MSLVTSAWEKLTLDEYAMSKFYKPMALSHLCTSHMIINRHIYSIHHKIPFTLGAKQDDEMGYDAIKYRSAFHSTGDIFISSQQHYKPCGLINWQSYLTSSHQKLFFSNKQTKVEIFQLSILLYCIISLLL